MWITLWMVSAVYFVGCASGDQTLEAVDPNAAPLDPEFETVFAIIQRQCTPCHPGEGEDEGEYAPRMPLGAAFGGAEPPLVTCTDVVEQARSILVEVDSNRMPPGAWPRLSERERLIIQRWIENGEKAPCK